jgi:hypothetical protein
VSQDMVLTEVMQTVSQLLAPMTQFAIALIILPFVVGFALKVGYSIVRAASPDSILADVSDEKPKRGLTLGDDGELIEFREKPKRKLALGDDGELIEVES